MAAADTSERSSSSGVFEAIGFGLLAYMPFLLSPGSLSSDTKQFLYLDPGRFLARAPYLWDRQVGAGTVSHQHIGYLFPMGPFFWLTESLGMSDRVAQRLWLGTISLFAGLGVRWLLGRLGLSRAGAIAGAIMYMLAPYQLAFTARMSVLLLPWAALGWIVGLVIEGVKNRSWRIPAALALIAMSVGSVNVSALAFVGIAPIIWIVGQCFSRRDLGAVWSFTWRSAALVIGASLWWLNGLRLQGIYGLPVLQLTENVRTVSEFSNVTDMLRGLGNWFFYGTEPDGTYSVVQATGYMSNRFVIFASYATPVLAIMAALVIKWRYRAYFVSLVLIGIVVGVGAHPYSSPSLVGRGWRSVAENWSLATALRNTPRVGPIIVLGFAGLIAAGITALGGKYSPRKIEWGVASIVGLVVLTAFFPVIQHGYFSEAFERPQDIPDYWEELAKSLNSKEGLKSLSSRVLEIPGSNFSVFRWGNTIEPVTPGITDVGYLAREVLPYGTEGTVNLLDAFDRRIQLGTFEPASLAPIARLFAAGTIVVRNDLVYEHGGSSEPRLLWADLTQPLAEGLENQQIFGDALFEAPAEALLNPIGQRLANAETSGSALPMPQVATFDLQEPNLLVATAPNRQPVLLVGDGDGIVDAAAAGIVDGRSLILELGALTDEQLATSLADGADIVLTDSNRLRYRNFFSSISRTSGHTEQVGEPLDDPNGYSHRPNLFLDRTDDERSVVVQLGGRAFATRDGGSGRPEATAAKAIDGDVRTAWRVDGAEVVGSRIVVEPQSIELLDSFDVVQALNWPRDRSITRIGFSVNDGRQEVVDLSPKSFRPAGQSIRFARQEVEKLEIEILATTVPPIEPRFANPIGLAEIKLGSAKIRETVRLPVALQERSDISLEKHGFDILMTRLRSEPGLFGSTDEELEIDRVFQISEDRAFELAGTARVNPNAPDRVLDKVLGTYFNSVSVWSSGHMQGDVGSRASMAFDGSTETAWTSEYGPQPGQWIQAKFDTPRTVDSVDLDLVTDGRHQEPSKIAIFVDGKRAATKSLAELLAGASYGNLAHVTVTFDQIVASRVQVVIEEVRPAAEIMNGYLPVSISEVTFENVANMLGPDKLTVLCREDLLFVDDEPISVRLVGDSTQMRSGLAVEACDGSLRLGAGTHTVRTVRGLDAGIDIDRIVLSRPRNGESSIARTPRGTRLPQAGTEITVADHDRNSTSITVTTDGEQFWLLLNESFSEGWHPTSKQAKFGTPTMVNGYANGWLVTPTAPGKLAIDLEWAPQQSVWLALLLSGAVVVGCFAILLAPRLKKSRTRLRKERRDDSEVAPAIVNVSLGYVSRPGGRSDLVAPVGICLLASLASTPSIGMLLALCALALARIRLARVVALLVVPVLVIGGRVLERPTWVWISLGLLAIDVVLSIEFKSVEAREEVAI